MGPQPGPRRHHVRDVQEHHADRRQGQVRNRSGREHSQEPRDPDRRCGCPILGRDSPQPARPRQPAIPREREHHPRSARHNRQPAQVLRQHNSPQQGPPQPTGQPLLQDVEEEVPPLGGGGVGIGNRQHQCDQQEPAKQRRDQHRPHDAAGDFAGRSHRLLRRMGRGVEPGDRVRGQQQAQCECPAGTRRFRPDLTPRGPGVVCQRQQSSPFPAVRRQQQGSPQHHRDPQDQVPAEVGQAGRCADASMVEQALRPRHGGDHQPLAQQPVAPRFPRDQLTPGGARDQLGQPLGHLRGVQSRPFGEGTKRELHGGHIDRGQDRNQPRQVEPRRGPPPTAAPQQRAPVIEPSRRRISRRHLGHRRRGGQREQADQGPAQPHAGPPRTAPAHRKRSDPPREDADDRE